MLPTNSRPQPSTGHPLGERPTPANDHLVAAAKRASVGAIIEIEAQRRRAAARPLDRISELERRIEALEALAFELHERVDLPF